MSTQLRLRRGNTTQTSAFTGALGEVTVDTDKYILVLHDGVTPGGHDVGSSADIQAAYNTANSAASFANGAFVTANNSYVTSNGAYAQANLAYAAANNDGIFANAAFITANSGASFANGAFVKANASYLAQNTTAGFANGAFLVANSASSNTVTTQGVDATQNTNISSAQSFANGAFTVANNANAIYASGGTIAGPVSITNTTGSTTYSSGALVVSGGAGIAGNLNVGGATSSFSGSVGVGIANALSKFSIVPGGVENTPTSDVMLHLNGDATYRRLQIDSNAVSGPVIMGRQAGGTPGALANTTSGSTLLYIDAAGYAVGGPGAGGYNNFSASMRFVAAEDFTTANAGSYISWSLTNTGSTSIYEAMRLYNGNLGVGASVGIPSANLTVAGSTSIQNTSNTASYGTTIIQATTATTAQTAIDTWSTSAYRSAKYMVQMTQGSNYHVIELKLLHDGTTVFLTQYGEITTGVNLGTFDATISGSTLSLFINPTSSTSMTINLVREAISI